MMELSACWRGQLLEALVEYTPGAPGRTWGPADLCYPDEPAELEVLALTCDGECALRLLRGPRGRELLAVLESAAADQVERLREPDEAWDSVAGWS